MTISTTTSLAAKRLGSDAAALRALADAGFDACDFSMWDYPWHGGLWEEQDEAFDRYFKDLRDKAREYGIAIGQTHAPFPTTALDEKDSAHRLRVIRRAIRATGLMDCPMIVIHPALHFHGNDSPDNAKAMRYNLEMYESLIPDLKAAHVKCALENMFGDDAQGRIVPTYFSTAEEILRALDALGNRHFCVCLDIGHIALLRGQPALEIRAVGPALGCLHLHDNNGMSDEHLLPFMGTIGWDAICEALRDIGYSGSVSLETGGFFHMMPEHMTRSALRLAAQIARDLATRIAAD